MTYVRAATFTYLAASMIPLWGCGGANPVNAGEQPPQPTASGAGTGPVGGAEAGTSVVPPTQELDGGHSTGPSAMIRFLSFGGRGTATDACVVPGLPSALPLGGGGADTYVPVPAGTYTLRPARGHCDVKGMISGFKEAKAMLAPGKRYSIVPSWVSDGTSYIPRSTLAVVEDDAVIASPAMMKFRMVNVSARGAAMTTGVTFDVFPGQDSRYTPFLSTTVRGEPLSPAYTSPTTFPGGYVGILQDYFSISVLVTPDAFGKPPAMKAYIDRIKTKQPAAGGGETYRNATLYVVGSVEDLAYYACSDDDPLSAGGPASPTGCVLLHPSM